MPKVKKNGFQAEAQKYRGDRGGRGEGQSDVQVSRGWLNCMKEGKSRGNTQALPTVGEGLAAKWRSACFTLNATRGHQTQ